MRIIVDEPKAHIFLETWISSIVVFTRIIVVHNHPLFIICEHYLIRALGPIIFSVCALVWISDTSALLHFSHLSDENFNYILKKLSDGKMK
uniref:Uncharacterized protein n=1 Tax=Solanum lycopersicum TaxID=4081 RepID=A0A3Q7FG23_SOLLC